MNVSDTPVAFTASDKALIDAYSALSVFATDPRWEPVIAENDPQTLKQALAAIETIEQALPPVVLLTILPTYTKVAVKTIDGQRIEGQTRDGAWGLCHASRSAVYPRRITTTAGFEMWVGPDDEIETFEILERP